MLAALNEKQLKVHLDYVEIFLIIMLLSLTVLWLKTLNIKFKSHRRNNYKKIKTWFIGFNNGFRCGTGLFGVEIKQFCEHLEGVDLSEKMLDEAMKKAVYNKLIKEDILAYLSNASLNFDYFVSTDVFIYIGDLSDIFRLVKSRNKKGGKLVFSTEDYEGDGFFLEQSGRYSHSKKYIEGLVKNLALNYVILKPKFSVKIKINISMVVYIY